MLVFPICKGKDFEYHNQIFNQLSSLLPGCVRPIRTCRSAETALACAVGRFRQAIPPVRDIGLEKRKGQNTPPKGIAHPKKSHSHRQPKGMPSGCKPQPSLFQKPANGLSQASNRQTIEFQWSIKTLTVTSKNGRFDRPKAALLNDKRADFTKQKGRF